MKSRKILSLLLLSLLILSLSAALISCGGGDEDTGILGSWLSRDAGEKFSRILYCFSESGHMLSVETMAGSTVSIFACHYTYEDGTLTIAEYGRETGELSVVWDGDDEMTLAVKSEGAKSMKFDRVEKATLPYVGASYVYTDPFSEEGSTTQYAFTDEATVAVATYEVGVMTDYATYTYSYKDGLLTLAPLTLSETQSALRVFRAAFHYDGYMTLEPLDAQPDENGITPVYPFARYVSE